MVMHLSVFVKQIDRIHCISIIYEVDILLGEASLYGKLSLPYNSAQICMTSCVNFPATTIKKDILCPHTEMEKKAKHTEKIFSSTPVENMSRSKVSGSFCLLSSVARQVGKVLFCMLKCKQTSIKVIIKAALTTKTICEKGTSGKMNKSKWKWWLILADFMSVGQISTTSMRGHCDTYSPPDTHTFI